MVGCGLEILAVAAWSSAPMKFCRENSIGDRLAVEQIAKAAMMNRVE